MSDKTTISVILSDDDLDMLSKLKKNFDETYYPMKSNRSDVIRFAIRTLYASRCKD